MYVNDVIFIAKDPMRYIKVKGMEISTEMGRCASVLPRGATQNEAMMEKCPGLPRLIPRIFLRGLRNSLRHV